eukprot:4904729-Amphidinium_carterae.1
MWPGKAVTQMSLVLRCRCSLAIQPCTSWPALGSLSRAKGDSSHCEQQGGVQPATEKAASRQQGLAAGCRGE